MVTQSSEIHLNPSKRLESLDILRGLDMFMLLFFQPVFMSIVRVANLPWLDQIAKWFEHEVWEGFTPWDLVMPLFLFMAGCSMPLAFSKALKSGNKTFLYRKVFKRFILLFILGMVVQGNLLGLDSHRIYLYSNTLQAIATGYLLSSFILLNFKFSKQCLCVFILLSVYAVPMLMCGDMTPQHNFAESLDRAVLGRFRDGVSFDELGNCDFAEWYTYTWIWSSLTFTVSVMLGAIATQIIKHAKNPTAKIAIILAVIGLGLSAVAVSLSGVMPIIKRIWTSTMALYAGGWSFLLLALAYYIVDVCQIKKGLGWLKIYGMNAITAYVIGEVVNFRSIVNSVCFGLEHHIGDWYQVVLTFGNFLILFFILLFLYKRRIFLRI